jgi:hypothetical protein
MTALGFKRRFVNPILEGTKGGTIRADRKDGRLPPIGGELQLYTAMRTTYCALILRSPCIAVAPIALHFKDRTRVVSQGRTWRGAKALDNFARFDGFGDFADMAAFWRETHNRREFFGNWIRWVVPASRVTMGATVAAAPDAEARAA